MAAKSRKPTPMKVSQMRERLDKLSGRYEELRQVIRAHQEANPGTTTREIGDVSGYSWDRVTHFMNGDSALMGGNRLPELGVLLDCSSLTDEIAEITGPLRECVVGLALETQEVRELSLDLLEAWRKQKHGLTQEQFAQAFEPYADIVCGTLQLKKEAYTRLRDEVNRAAIRKSLRSGLDNRLQGIAATHRALKQEVIDEINALLKPYYARHKTLTRVAETMGMTRQRLSEVVNALVTFEKIQLVREEIRNKIQELESESKRELPLPVAPDSGAVQSAISPNELLNPDADLLPASLLPYAGETVDGQPFVLTTASFREVETREIVDFADMLERMLGRTRAMVNIAAQIRDEQAADILRGRVNREVVELYRSLQIFTSVHPNALTEIYDSERQIKTVQRATHGTSKGKGA